MTHALAERFGAMERKGLLDLRFDVRRMPPDGGLKAPVRDFAETFSADTVLAQRFFADRVMSEVAALYTAVDAGLETPLDFKDSTRS